jgi:hypothetical protein
MGPMSRPNTTHLFDQRKDDKRKTLTHEQISNDLDAFKRAGGKIEVLGNTLTLRTIPISARQDAAAPAPDATTTKDKSPAT